MALAYYNLERYGDSVEAARWALRLEPNYDPAHYVLGARLVLPKQQQVVIDSPEPSRDNTE